MRNRNYKLFYQDPENKRLLVENKVAGHTIIQWLGNLLHSPTEQIATYAAVTLYAIDDQTKVRASDSLQWYTTWVFVYFCFDLGSF